MTDVIPLLPRSKPRTTDRASSPLPVAGNPCPLPAIARPSPVPIPRDPGAMGRRVVITRRGIIHCRGTEVKSEPEMATRVSPVASPPMADPPVRGQCRSARQQEHQQNQADRNRLFSHFSHPPLTSLPYSIFIFLDGVRKRFIQPYSITDRFG